MRECLLGGPTAARGTCGVVRVRVRQEVAPAARVLESEAVHNKIRAANPFQVLHLGSHHCTTRLMPQFVCTSASVLRSRSMAALRLAPRSPFPGALFLICSRQEPCLVQLPRVTSPDHTTGLSRQKRDLCFIVLPSSLKMRALGLMAANPSDRATQPQLLVVLDVVGFVDQDTVLASLGSLGTRQRPCMATCTPSST